MGKRMFQREIDPEMQRRGLMGAAKKKENKKRTQSASPDENLTSEIEDTVANTMGADDATMTSNRSQDLSNKSLPKPKTKKFNLEETLDEANEGEDVMTSFLRAPRVRPAWETPRGPNGELTPLARTIRDPALQNIQAWCLRAIASMGLAKMKEWCKTQNANLPEVNKLNGEGFKKIQMLDKLFLLRYMNKDDCLDAIWRPQDEGEGANTSPNSQLQSQKTQVNQESEKQILEENEREGKEAEHVMKHTGTSTVSQPREIGVMTNTSAPTEALSVPNEARGASRGPSRAPVGPPTTSTGAIQNTTVAPQAPQGALPDDTGASQASQESLTDATGALPILKAAITAPTDGLQASKGAPATIETPEAPAEAPLKGPTYAELQRTKRQRSPESSASSRISKPKKAKLGIAKAQTDHEIVVELPLRKAPTLKSGPNIEEIIFQHPAGVFKAVYEPTTIEHKNAFWTDFIQTAHATRSSLSHEVFNSGLSKAEIGYLDIQAAFRLMPSLVNSAGELRVRAERISKNAKDTQHQLGSKANTFRLMAKAATKQADKFERAQEEFTSEETKADAKAAIEEMNSTTEADLASVIKGIEQPRQNPAHFAQLQENLADYLTSLGERFRIELTPLVLFLEKQSEAVAERQDRLLQLLEYAMLAMRTGDPHQHFLPGHLEFLSPDSHVCECVKCTELAVATKPSPPATEAGGKEDIPTSEPLWFEAEDYQAIPGQDESLLRFFNFFNKPIEPDESLLRFGNKTREEDDFAYYYRHTNGLSKSHGDLEAQWKMQVKEWEDRNKADWEQGLINYQQLSAQDQAIKEANIKEALEQVSLERYEPTAEDLTIAREAKTIVDARMEYDRGQWLIEYSNNPRFTQPQITLQNQSFLSLNPFTPAEVQAMQAPEVELPQMAPLMTDFNEAYEDFRFESKQTGPSHYADPTPTLGKRVKQKAKDVILNTDQVAQLNKPFSSAPTTTPVQPKATPMVAAPTATFPPVPTIEPQQWSIPPAASVPHRIMTPYEPFQPRSRFTHSAAQSPFEADYQHPVGHPYDMKSHNQNTEALQHSLPNLNQTPSQRGSIPNFKIESYATQDTPRGGYYHPSNVGYPLSLSQPIQRPTPLAPPSPQRSHSRLQLQSQQLSQQVPQQHPYQQPLPQQPLPPPSYHQYPATELLHRQPGQYSNSANSPYPQQRAVSTMNPAHPSTYHSNEEDAYPEQAPFQNGSPWDYQGYYRDTQQGGQEALMLPELLGVLIHDMRGSLDEGINISGAGES